MNGNPKHRAAEHQPLSLGGLTVRLALAHVNWKNARGFRPDQPEGAHLAALTRFNTRAFWQAVNWHNTSVDGGGAGETWALENMMDGVNWD